MKLSIEIAIACASERLLSGRELPMIMKHQARAVRSQLGGSIREWRLASIAAAWRTACTIYRIADEFSRANVHEKLASDPAIPT